ncbi:hypothetical protein UUA_12785 [Rhodanobacter thiooxydans LCS2]|nr:hypothetical protein UUA_12785 [Rhodanobacter thiooxydans LCS2]
MAQPVAQLQCIRTEPPPVVDDCRTATCSRSGDQLGNRGLPGAGDMEFEKMAPVAQVEYIRAVAIQRMRLDQAASLPAGNIRRR